METETAKNDNVKQIKVELEEEKVKIKREILDPEETNSSETFCVSGLLHLEGEDSELKGELVNESIGVVSKQIASEKVGNSSSEEGKIVEEKEERLNSYESSCQLKFKENTSEKLDNKQYGCPKCNFTTYYKHSLKTHALLHAEKKLFNCLKCDFQTNYKYAYERHELDHLGIKQFKCSKCDYATNIKCDLEKHADTHSSVNCYKCGKCDYAAKSKRYLDRHTLLHLEYKKYKCSKCNFGTNIKGNLRTHEIVHSESKQYKCSRCQYETKYSNNFKRHQSLHLKPGQNDSSDNASADSHRTSDVIITRAENELLANLMDKEGNKCRLEGGGGGGIPQPSSDASSGRVKKEWTTESSPPEQISHSIQMIRKLLSYSPIVGQKPTWSMVEKREILWCSVYATHRKFRKFGIGERRRKMLLERGIIDKKKIDATPDCRFHSIYAHIKTGRARITKEEIEQTIKEVDKIMNIEEEDED